MTAESQQMYMAFNRRGQTKKGAGYISSSIFKPSSSENSDGADYLNNKYQQLDDGYGKKKVRAGDRSGGTKYNNTQKQVKLKQLRLKNNKDQEKTPSNATYIYNRRNQNKSYVPGTAPYKKSFVGSGSSLPPVDKTDTLSNTPRRQNIRQIRNQKRLNTGNLHLTQSPPLSNVDDPRRRNSGSRQRNMLNVDQRDHYRPPSWGGGPISSIGNQDVRSIQKKIIPSPQFQKSLPKSLKSLPTLKVLPGGALDVQTQSDIALGAKTPSAMNTKGDNTDSKAYSYGKNVMINQGKMQHGAAHYLPWFSVAQPLPQLANPVGPQLERQNLSYTQQLTPAGITFQDTRTSSMQPNKPPLNQMSMKRNRRRQIRNPEPVQQLGQQQYGQPTYFLPPLNKSISGPLNVQPLDNEQQIPQYPYAIVPMDQPIMMVNYSQGGPYIQPMRYRSYSELPEPQIMGTAAGQSSQMHMQQDIESSADDNVYYQLVTPSENYRRSQQQDAYSAYKRKQNSINNWRWLTQRLVEFEQTKVDMRLQKLSDTRLKYQSERELEIEVTEQSAQSDVRVTNKNRQKRVMLRWDRLLRGVLGGSWRGYYSATKNRKNLYNNLQMTRTQQAVLDRWRRLLFKSMQEFGSFTPNLIGEPDMILQNFERQKKHLKIQVYYRWNLLIRKSLQRIKSNQAQSNIQRWINLLKSAQIAGYLDLPNANMGQVGLQLKKTRTLQVNARWVRLTKLMLKTHTLKVNAKWVRITKLLLKHSKQNSLDVLGKWRRLVNKVLQQTQPQKIDDDRSRSLRIHAKWRKIAIMVVQTDDRGRSLHLMGKWRQLINKLLNSNLRSKKMLLNTRWKKLAVKILQKDKKMKRLRAIGNWGNLYNSLKRYEYEILRERRGRKLGICARWAKMTRKLLQAHGKQQKLDKLETLGRWRTLINGLKKLEQKELRKTRERSLEAHGRLYQLARNYLKSYNKIQSLRVIGRWRTLYVGLKTYEFQDKKEQKIRRMQINAKWRLMAQAALKRAHKMKSLQNTSKWHRFARMLLHREDNIEGNIMLNRWKILIRKLASKPRNDLRLASIKTMKIGEQIKRLEKQHEKIEKLSVLGKWNQMAWALLQHNNSQLAQEEKLQRLYIIGKWKKLSRRAIKKHDIRERWAKVIHKLHQKRGNHFSLNFMKRIQINNKVHREKIEKLQVNAKWAQMARKVLQMHRQQRLNAGINLRRLAMKLLRREKRQEIEAKWRIVVQKAVQCIREQEYGQVWYDQQHKRGGRAGVTNPSFEVVCKWGRISRKLVKKHDGRMSMEARVNLARLARKLLIKNQDEVEEEPQSSSREAVQISRKAKRQAVAHKRLKKLAMKLVVHDARKKSRKAHFDLARLARGLIKKHKGQMFMQPNDPWRNLYLKLHQHKIAAVCARHDKRTIKRTRHLGNLEKWELLTAYLIEKKKQEKSQKIQKKWRKIIIKMMSIYNFY